MSGLRLRRARQVAVHQNFVPVVDSRGVLMGIVTRKAVIGWLRNPAT